MTNWLERQAVTVQPLDFGKVYATLNALEASYGAIREARKSVDHDFGREDSAPRRAQLRNIQAKAKATLDELRQQVKTQFAELQQQAAANRADAYKQFAQSGDGRHFREALAAFAPLAQTMPPDMLAAQIQNATAAGLTAEARAWSQLARMRFAASQGIDDNPGQSRYPSTALRLALENADNVARTPAEMQADDTIATVDNASRRFGVYSGTIDDRLTVALSGQAGDVFAGNFTPATVFGMAVEGGE
jgi:hypothetical protein